MTNGGWVFYKNPIVWPVPLQTNKQLRKMFLWPGHTICLLYNIFSSQPIIFGWPECLSTMYMYYKIKRLRQIKKQRYTFVIVQYLIYYLHSQNIDCKKKHASISVNARIRIVTHITDMTFNLLQVSQWS